MARLIIGHTTHNSTRIWVRGDKRNPVAFLTVSDSKQLSRTYKKTLEERFGYTGVFDVGTLKPSTEYIVNVQFGESENESKETRIEYGHTQGKFKTFTSNKKNNDVKFLIGSCNLHSLGFWQNPDRSFKTLLNLAKKDAIDFMIHCGDQIYYDIPNFLKQPDFNEYRLKYVDAWSDSRPTRKFLTQLPQYMILDDHELVNNFSNDMLSTRSGASPGDIKKHGIRVYREFQHIHNPNVYGNQALYYNFSYGGVQYFCLDTRSERVSELTSQRTMMIDNVQMSHFKRWLSINKNAIKFVITSVPFVGHVENNTDKWCSKAFRHQREEIIQHIVSNQIKGVVFLTGDMHNSYHATLDVQMDNKNSIIHELMSSPINQTSKSSYGKYITNHTLSSINDNFNYTSDIKKNEFYNEHSNVMIVKVKNRNVSFEVVRARTAERNEIKGAFAV